MRTNLDLSDLGNLLEQPVLAILGTHRRNGRILMAPVWFEWLDGGFSIVTWAGDIKSRCIARDPRTTILAAASEAPYSSLEVSGEASVTRAPNLIDNVARMAVRYLGADQGAKYTASYEGVDLELIRLEPGRIRAWDFADDI